MIISFKNDENWIVLSEIEQRIKAKIEAAGTPLKDWDINIYRGILTGFNEAFIISGDKKNEILANCKDKDERIRTDELIRPILRGRDIKRYSYDFADLWLINTHNGVKEKGIKPVNVDNYPAIKQHLDKYLPLLEKRQDKGDTPYNLRNCAYIEDFNRPKIIYPDISTRLSFCFSDDNIYCTNTAYFIIANNSSDLEYLLTYLNSNLINWYYKTLSVQLGADAVRMFSIYVLKIPIPKKSTLDVNKAFGLSQEEIDYIETISNN